MKEKARRYKKLHQFSVFKRVECTNTLNQYQNVLSDISDKLDSLNGDYETLVNDMLMILAGKDAYNVCIYENAKRYLSELLKQIENEKNSKCIAEQHVNQAKDNLHGAIVESNGYKAVFENSMNEYVKSVDAFHQKELDEVSRISFIRKNRR